LRGTVANTDRGWFEFLRGRPDLDEVNFWSPSPRMAFRGDPLTPFFFRLKAPDRAIAGFAFFARYERLPVWLAWDAFGLGNGVDSLEELQSRLDVLRTRIRYEPPPGPDQIGCIILVEPLLFPPDLWIREPADWKPRTQAYRYYDLSQGEGRLLWERCLEAAATLAEGRYDWTDQAWAERAERYGNPQLIRPRLGQGTFRIATMEAYDRACALTGEHSLPALDAAHIKPFGRGGDHTVTNGIFMRADLHRLFDRGYVTVTPELDVLISTKLREDFENGRTYYPLHGGQLRLPSAPGDRPDSELLAWHNESIFRE
jgi:putative restriction endonuclease